MLCASIDHIHKLCNSLFTFSFLLRGKKRIVSVEWRALPKGNALELVIREQPSRERNEPFTTERKSEAILHVSSRALNCKRRQREKHAKDFCAACGIALTEWTYVLFASLTKSFRFCYRAYAHAKLLSVTHVSESGERARSAIVSLERIWAESSNNI